MGEAKRRGERGDTRPRSRRTDRTLLVGAVVAVLLLIGAGLFFWLTSPTLSPLDDLPRAAEGAAPFPAEFDRHGISLGDPNAPVVVREFADYQCPGCGLFAEQVERLKREYVDTGKVRFVYFDFPLGQHRNAVPAALAARCAGDQQAFWPMQSLLFERQARWSNQADPAAVFAGFARELKLDEGRFSSCLAARRHLPAIERSLEVARQLRVASTPTVFVDNVLLTRPGWYQLAGVVERQLAAGR
jgi:protein-disulfide isomerase